MRVRAAAKSLKEEDGAARAEMRVGIIRPSCNADRQKGMAWESDVGGQSGLVEAESVKFEAAHLLKRRGGDYIGDWVIEKVGSSRLGVGWSNRMLLAQLIGLASEMG